MANTLKIKRGTAATIPQGQLAEPLFTTDTYDLYIGKGAGGNQRIQNYIASGTSSQFLKGDGSLDSNTYQTALTFSSPLVNTSGTVTINQSSGSANGYLSSTDWTTFNSKEPAITAGTTSQYYRGDKTFQTLDTAAVPENGAIYFTEPRVRATVLTGLNLSGGGTIAATDSILTAFGKVQNQISALVGGATYQGTWNASTNTPTLASGTGTKGYYYVVSVAGSTNLDGITDWKVGDWAIFNGTTWDKVDNTDAVSSVNGFTGAVNLALDNISDVSAASPTNAQLLRFNGTSSNWENWTPTYISAAITSLNGLTGATQTFATGTSGTDFAISSAGTVHTFNLPIASATNTGKLSSTDWSTFNAKEPALTKGNLTEATSSVLTITGGTGAVIGSGTTIAVASAGAAQNGVVTTGTQTFAGAKTFSSDVTINSLTAGRGAGNDSSNTVFGNSALGGSTAAVAGNTAIGSGSLGSNTSGFGNTALGFGSLGQNTTGQSNTAIGVTAGQLIIGSYNTFVGRQAFSQATSGSNNTIIGYAAGIDITSGSNNTLIGGYTGPASALSGNVIISDGSGNIRFLHNGTNGKLPFLTSNGFVKTSGGDGTLSVDTTSYLPLTGGTLTGALSGTSATFSDTVNINKAAAISSLIIKSSSSTTGLWLYLNGLNATLSNQDNGSLSFETNGTNRLTISSTGAATFSGNITSNGNTLSVINGSGSADLVLDRFSTSFGATYQYKTNGTLKWYTGLRGLANDNFYIFNNATSTNTLILDSSTNAATFSSSVTATGGTASYSTSALPTATISTTTTGAINAAYTSIRIGARGQSGQDQSVAITNVPTADGNSAIAFTTMDSYSYAERMRITSGGNVGIGATTVNNKLLVKGGLFPVRVEPTGSSTDGTSIELGYNGITFNSSAASYKTFTIQNALNDASADLNILNGAGTGITLKNTGNVGIGSSSPTSILDASLSSGATSGFRFKGYSDASTPYLLSLGTHTYQDIFQIKSVNGLVTMGIVGAVGSTPDLAFQTNSTERMRITSGGIALIGVTSASAGLGAGGLHVSDRIAIASGSVGTPSIHYATDTNTGIYFPAADTLGFSTGGTERMRITSGGNIEATGSIKTGAPSGGTAKPWKLGARLSGTVSTSTTNYLEVEVDGTLYYLAFAVPL